MLLKYIIVLLIGVALPFALNYGVAHLIFWFHYRSTIHTNEWFWDNELDDHDRERIAWEESYHHGRLIAATLTAAYFLIIGFFIYLKLFSN